jgi:hypothetical protein
MNLVVVHVDDVTRKNSEKVYSILFELENSEIVLDIYHLDGNYFFLDFVGILECLELVPEVETVGTH